MNNPIGRKHELSLLLKKACNMADYDEIWGNDEKCLMELMKLAHLLADYDIATLEELKERLK